MVLAEDEETQKKGLVSVIFIMCGNSKSKRFHNESTFKISSVGAKAIPLRIEAMHFCQDSLLTLAVTSIVKITFGLFNRLRVRTHYGKLPIDIVERFWRHVHSSDCVSHTYVRLSLLVWSPQDRLTSVLSLSRRLEYQQICSLSLRMVK
jgi:hypothetical protein